MRQARALKIRAANSEEDEFGDVIHEFQDLVHKAVAKRRSRRSSLVSLDRSHSPNPLSGSMEQLTSPRSEKSLRLKSPSRRNSGRRRLSPGSSDVSRRGSRLSVSSVESGDLQ